MSGPMASLLVFSAMTASVLGGSTLQGRAPRLLATPETRETIRRVVGLVAMLAALMLGMSIVQLKNSFDGATGDVRRLASEIEELNRTLHRIGNPAEEARQLLFRFTAVVLRDEFPAIDAPLQGEPHDADTLQDDLEAALEQMPGAADGSRVATQAQAVLHAIVQTRWSMQERSGKTLGTWQIGILAFWLVVIFGGLGLTASRDPVVLSVLLLGAVALAAAVFLLTEYDDPFRGIISVSGQPLLEALHALAD